jgi:hypothetical protein
MARSHELTFIGQSFNEVVPPDPFVAGHIIDHFGLSHLESAVDPTISSS